MAAVWNNCQGRLRCFYVGKTCLAPFGTLDLKEKLPGQPVCREVNTARSGSLTQSFPYLAEILQLLVFEDSGSRAGAGRLRQIQPVDQSRASLLSFLP